MNTSADRIEHIVIVGAGLAGVSAAEELRALGYTGAVTLLSAESHLPYDRPPLSKAVMLGDKTVDETALHPESWYAEHDLQLHRGCDVTGIDLTDRRVICANETFGYDRLLLATGSDPRPYALPDNSDVDVQYLRSRDDAASLKERLRGRLLIVGGGWIGLELAAAARIAGGEVVVVEAASLPLVNVVGTEVATMFTELHRSHGVDVRTGTTVTGARTGPDGTMVQLSDGSEVVVDTVIGAIGAVPRVELARAAGLGCSNGIDVDARLCTSDPLVFAAGDIAAHDHPQLGRIRVEHWDNAIAQGRHAAHSMLGEVEPYVAQPYFFTDQYDLGMEYVGHPGAAGYDAVHVRGDVDTRVFTAYFSRGDQVVAGLHCNDWDATDQIRTLVGGPVSALPD